MVMRAPQGSAKKRWYFSSVRGPPCIFLSVVSACHPSLPMVAVSPIARSLSTYASLSAADFLLCSFGKVPSLFSSLLSLTDFSARWCLPWFLSRPRGGAGSTGTCATHLLRWDRAVREKREAFPYGRGGGAQLQFPPWPEQGDKHRGARCYSM
jgi:hypothetical protein